jgi:hypothetical protein
MRSGEFGQEAFERARPHPELYWATRWIANHFVDQIAFGIATETRADFGSFSMKIHVRWLRTALRSITV